jgi:hypothetical protein
MTRFVLAAAPSVALLLMLTSPAGALNDDIVAAQAAIGYVQDLQEDDGGYPAFGPGSAPGSTIDAVLAFVSYGSDPTVHTQGGDAADDYLATQATSYASDPGAAAKLALGVALMGLDASNFGGVNLVSTMAASYNSGTGAYGLDTFDAAYHLLALDAAGEAVPPLAVQDIEGAQATDGGWEFFPGGGSDQNTTAFVVQALIGAGVAAHDSSIIGGLSYLATAQNGDGGFGFLPGEPTDPNSTAFAIQALAAAGQNIDSGTWAPGGNSPVDALLTFRNAATGAFQFFGEDSPFATYQAVPALMRAPFYDLHPQKSSADTDGDGCTDAQENGPGAATGGRRSYLNPWDFYDVNGDRVVTVGGDILIVATGFGPSDPQLNPGYVRSYDRSPAPAPGADPTDPLANQPWDLGPPDGFIGVAVDILGAAAQFGHTCS